MTARITELIDWQDGYELVRDEVAAILAVESVGQQALATAQGKDPNLWKLDVYMERSRPWERWVDVDPEDEINDVPIVNVTLDANEESTKTSAVRGERSTVRIHIDVYGYACAADSIDGHTTADRSAALVAQRAARLCRNILMSEDYTYLGSPRKALQWVFGRKVSGLNMFQPEIPMKTSPRAAQTILGARIVLEVECKLRVPVFEGQLIEMISLTVDREEDGRVIARADYELPKVLLTESGEEMTTEDGELLMTES